MGVFLPSCLETVLPILFYIKDDTDINVGNKITQKPHSSWVSFYLIIQLFFRHWIPYFCNKAVLFYKHRIPEAEETITLLNSCLVGMHNMLFACQCRDEH